MRLLTLLCVFGATLSLPLQQEDQQQQQQQQDQSPDQEEEAADGSRKLLGSSVVTSVSVILDIGNGTLFSDAVGHPIAKPMAASQVASPIDFLHPDRYEFYTFDDSGDLVKRLMTLNEIQGIIANGDGEANNYNSLPPEEYNPEKKVNDVVENVQNVLKEQMEVLKSNASGATSPVLDTPDVSSTWSMILPAIFGNSGEDIAPVKPQAQATPDTIMIDQNSVTVEPNVISSSIQLPAKEKPRPEPVPTATEIVPIEVSTESVESTPAMVNDVISSVAQHTQDLINALASSTTSVPPSSQETERVTEKIVSTERPKIRTTTAKATQTSSRLPETAATPAPVTAVKVTTETTEAVKNAAPSSVPTTAKPIPSQATRTTTTGSPATSTRTTEAPQIVKTTSPVPTATRPPTKSSTTPKIASVQATATTTEIPKPKTTTRVTTGAPKDDLTTASSVSVEAVTTAEVPFTTFFSVDGVELEGASSKLPTSAEVLEASSTQNYAVQSQSTVSVPKVTSSNLNTKATTVHITTPANGSIASGTTEKISTEKRPEVSVVNIAQTGVIPNRKNVTATSTTTASPPKVTSASTLPLEHRVGSSTIDDASASTTESSASSATSTTTRRSTTPRRRYNITDSPIIIITEFNKGHYPATLNPASLVSRLTERPLKLRTTTAGRRPPTFPTTTVKAATSTVASLSSERVTESTILGSTVQKIAEKPSTNSGTTFTEIQSSTPPNKVKPTTEFEALKDIPIYGTTEQTKYTKIQTINPSKIPSSPISSTTNKIASSTASDFPTSAKPDTQTSTETEIYLSEITGSTTIDSEIPSTTTLPEKDETIAEDIKHDDVDFEHDFLAESDHPEDNLVPEATNNIHVQTTTDKEDTEEPTTEFNAFSTQNMLSSFEQIVAQALSEESGLQANLSDTPQPPVHSSEYLFESTTDPNLSYRKTDRPETVDSTNAEFDKAVSSLIYQIVKEPDSIIKEFFPSTTTQEGLEKMARTTAPPDGTPLDETAIPTVTETAIPTVTESATATVTESATTPVDYTTEEPMALFFNRFAADGYEEGAANDDDKRFQLETTTAEAVAEITTETRTEATETSTAAEVTSAEKVSEAVLSPNPDALSTTSLRPQPKVTAKADLSLEMSQEEEEDGGYVRLETSTPPSNGNSDSTTSEVSVTQRLQSTTTTPEPETVGTTVTVQVNNFETVQTSTQSSFVPTTTEPIPTETTTIFEEQPPAETTVPPTEKTTLSTLPPERETTTTVKTTENLPPQTSWTLVPTIDPHQSNSVAIVTTTEEAKPVPETSAPVNLVSEPVQGLEASTSRLEPDIYEFTELCNELAFKFWQSVTTMGLSSARSVFVSPFATTSLLAMVFLGARGATSGEMNEILKLDDMVTFNPHLIFKNVSDSIDASLNPGVATSVIVRELFSDKSKGKLLNFYKDRARYFYDGHVEEAGFRRIGDVIRRRTSLIVKRMTNGKITEFVKDASITVRPPLAAISSSIFQTDCSKASTEGRDGELYFVVLPSIRQRRLVPVPAAVWRSGFLAGYDPSLDATAVSLGTKDDTLSTIFVIPGQQGIAAPGDGLARLEQRLVDISFRTGSWNRLIRTLIPRPGLEVQIPRFSHKSIINATVALQRMGLKELFDTEKADLRGLNGVAHDLHLSDMLQMNQFSMCGENGLDAAHHSEIYPATANRAYRTSRLVRTSDFTTYDYSDEPRDYQRSYHDPLHDPSLFSLPLSLRPRQARVPAAPRLRFDRPFLYFVRHNPTGLILHMGRFNPRLLP